MRSTQITFEQTTRLVAWLQVSSEIMSSIENESEPSDYQKHEVGMEWAGTLSRLR